MGYRFMPKDQLDYKIVKFHKSHVQRFREISDLLGKNTFPDITDSLVFARCSVVDKKGTVIGGGFLRHTAEATIYLDPTLSKFKRAEIMDSLFSIGKSMANKKGINEIHAFLFNMPVFGNYLRKKLDFVKVSAEVYCVRF